jgi:hypothetical protein
MVKPELESETIEPQTYWSLRFPSIPQARQDTVHLLPAFDEFIISYKDRQAALPFENFNKAVSDNGIFRPIVVVNGQVTGIWKRTINKDKIIVETKLFESPDRTTLRLIETAAEQYGSFLGKETETNHFNV